MTIKNVVTVRIRGEPCFLGSIYNDKTKTFQDGQQVITQPILHCWKDTVGNTFAIGETGTLYQVEFWREADADNQRSTDF